MNHSILNIYYIIVQHGYHRGGVCVVPIFLYLQAETLTGHQSIRSTYCTYRRAKWKPCCRSLLSIHSAQTDLLIRKVVPELSSTKFLYPQLAIDYLHRRWWDSRWKSHHYYSVMTVCCSWPADRMNVLFAMRSHNGKFVRQISAQNLPKSEKNRNVYHLQISSWNTSADCVHTFQNQSADQHGLQW